MARRFLTNINLEKNELQNVVIHKLATAPSTPVEGQLYYNTTDDRYYIRQSSAWKDITGRLDDLSAAVGASYILITDNGDGTMTIDVSSATTSTKGLMSSTDKSKLDNSTAVDSASTLVQRDAQGDFAANDVTTNSVVITETISGSTPGNHAVTKSYVDGLISSGVSIVGSIDCSTDPNYPAATGGEAYYVSVDGRIGGSSGPLVKVGDMIIAASTNSGGTEASVGSDWLIIERNLDYATETTAGYIQIATQTETDTGTDNTKAITPKKLKDWASNADLVNSYADDVGDGTSTKVFIVNHALGTSDVQVQVKDNSTLEVVEPDIEITDSNNVTIEFKTAPSLDAYRVVVVGSS